MKERKKVLLTTLVLFLLKFLRKNVAKKKFSESFSKNASALEFVDVVVFLVVVDNGEALSPLKVNNVSKFFERCVTI